MAPFFSRRSRRKRDSTLTWLEQTYDPRRDLHDTIHTFDEESYSSDSTTSNPESMFDITTWDSPLNCALLDSHKVNGLSKSAAGMAPTTRMTRLAIFASASAACLTILLNVEHILNTILILLLFAPYPPRLRHSRFILLIPLIGHDSVRTKAKSEFVLIFSAMSAMSFLDWNSIGSSFSAINTTTPPDEATGSDICADSHH